MIRTTTFLTWLLLSLWGGSLLAQGPFTDLYLIGDASPGGWSLGDATPLTQDANDSTVFTWTGVLTAGEFKFVDYTSNFCDGTDLVATTAAADPLAATAYNVVVQCNGDDNKWVVSQSGVYAIELFTANDSIAVALQSSYLPVYLIGDATPNGWDINAPTPLFQDANDPATFTWRGTLTAGEFKFPLFVGDWCDGEWINAAVPDQVLNATDFLFTQGCDGPDNKWRVAPADSGEYRITLDLAAETIDIVRLDSSTTAIAAWTAASVAVYPNPTQDRLTVRLPQAQPTELTLYTVTGQRLQTWHGQAQKMTLSLPEQPSGSLLLLRITTADGSVVKQVLRR